MLSGKLIKKSYGNTEILHGVNIRVTPGRITLLVGPSGSGKTTLLKCLAFLEKPDSGNIAYNGHSIDYPVVGKQSIFTPWPEITVVFQQQFLWPHLSIRANLLLPVSKRGKLEGLGFDELVTLFEMNDYLDRFPNQVSIGQRQRAALARALLLRPKFILLDEITSSLDVENIGKVARLLLELRNRGIGILLITHLLGFAKKLLARGEGDMVVFLDGGKVLQSGGKEVFDFPIHNRVKEFVSQMEYSE